MKPQEITELARYYVLNKAKNNEDKLNYYLEHWKSRKPSTLKQLYKNMLDHAQNRRGMDNSIGSIDSLNSFLCDFNPGQVKEYYNNDWEKLFGKVLKSTYSPPGRMEKRNNSNYWVIYCKSALSIANFLSRFKDVNEFNNYVNKFVSKDNPDLRIALPILLEKEIFGYGFALAADFIKENVSPEFVKPDTHIKDIFKGIRVCNENDSDFDIFRKVIWFSDSTDKNPYYIDKLFWLIGSGKFYETEKYPKAEPLKTNKKEFMDHINSLK